MLQAMCFLMLMCSTPTYAEEDEKTKRIKVLEKCWEKSFAYSEMVEEDGDGNSFGDPYYEKKLQNDGECHAFNRSYQKKYGKELTCRYSRENLGYTCKVK